MATKRKRSSISNSSNGDEDAPWPLSTVNDSQTQAQAVPASVRVSACPYLDTVCHAVLDFDMEKVCSVSLSKQNVYCCLVCGKFLSGRGKATPAYTHSVQHGHFVYLKLDLTSGDNQGQGRFYCLPDNYEVVDPSLDDIKYSLSPSYSGADITRLENDNRDLSRDVHGASYLPGFLGLNNLGCTDYVNAAVRALSHVRLFRNYFLQPENYDKHCRSVVVDKLGDCLRRLWSSSSLKSNVSPQGLINAVSSASTAGTGAKAKRRFQLTNSGSGGGSTECVDFFNWLLSEVHKGLTATASNADNNSSSSSSSSGEGGSAGGAKTSIVTDCFQGLIEVTEQRRRAGAAGAAAEDVPWKETKRRVPFQHLSLDIPPPPLFKVGEEELIIPTVNIYQLLQKFDGKKWTEALRGEEHVRRSYRILKLPPVLVFHLVRVTDKTGFRKERNPTIVTFPLRHLDMREYCSSGSGSAVSAVAPAPVPTVGELTGQSVSQLKEVVRVHGTSVQLHALAGCDKKQLLQVATEVVTAAATALAQKHKYSLLANICRESTQATALQGISVGAATESTLSRVSVSNSKAFKIHLQNRPTKQWFELEDLHVTEIEPSQIGVSEASILIFETGV